MKSTLTFLIVISLTLGYSVAVFSVRDEDIVLYYNFDEENDSVKDVSGNGHDGIISGSPEWIDSEFGKAIFFEGVGQANRQYIDINGILPIGDTDNTVVMWVKVPPDANGGGTNRVGILLGTYDKPSNCNWEIHGNGQVRIWWNNGQHDYKGINDVRDNEWHHLAFVRNKVNKQFIMYVDGEIDLSSGGSSGDDVIWQDEHRVAGDKRGDNSPWYNGAMDELAIWDVALSDDEIKQVMTEVTLSVSHAGKLSVTWSSIKVRF